MKNPYLIDRPGVVSFSGGRTSGYMLWHILQAYGGTLPDDLKVVFCNTGKERPETLDFVERCSLEWGVPVVWLEYRKDFIGSPELETYGRGPTGFAIVNYHSAKRDGFPLETVIAVRAGDSGYLPNPLVRYCTIECKIKTTIRYLKSLGWTHWTNAVGFRHDEPARVVKLNGQNREECEDGVAPLNDARVSKADVWAWWGRQPFRLSLLEHEGNCDLCFLKGARKIRRILEYRPDLADWWIRQEDRGGTFRKDRPRYAVQLQLAQRPGLFDATDEPDELSIACHCTD